MITHEIIQQMERELKSNLEQLMLAKHETRNERIVALFHSYTRKIVESVAEEIIGEDETEAGQIARDEKLGVQTYYVITANMKRRNQLRAEQRLKVKEIITILK